MSVVFSFSFSPVRILRLIPIDVRIAEISFVLEFSRICKQKIPAAFVSGHGCWEFELPADLLGIPLGKSPNRAPQGGGGQTKDGRPSSSERAWGGLYDLYEPAGVQNLDILQGLPFSDTMPHQGS